MYTTKITFVYCQRCASANLFIEAKKKLMITWVWNFFLLKNTTDVNYLVFSVSVIFCYIFNFYKVYSNSVLV